MKKKIIITFSIILLIIISLGAYSLYKYYRVKNAIKIVKQGITETEVYSEIKLKDIIEDINGKLISNPKIDTTKIGKKKIKFEYITDENIKVPYTLYLNVVDKTPPIISMYNNYSVDVGTNKEELEQSFFCGDNYDNNPKCELLGEFNLNEAGTYEVTFQGTDSSNNISKKKFNLNVKEKTKKSTNNTNSNNTQTYTDYNEIIKEYKTDNTRIGIDVSHWQGDIDFNKLKNNGVEFAYIRVGRGDGIGKNFVLDTKFEQNIKGFNNVGIPVGIYFYSYANSPQDAIKEAKWVMSKIKKYKVDLEIVFDWENWSFYQEFDLSFYKLTKTAEAFISTVEKEGYQGMLYSSKNYLENIWYPTKSNIWLAHYTKKTNYEGNYKVWQICEDGVIDGINGVVDIDIMYNH